MTDLIKKAKMRDKAAFSALIKENMQSMYKVAAAILKNDEDTSDAISETILICWEKISELKKDAYFKTWLIRILINQCNAAYQQKRRVQPYEIVPEDPVMDEGYRQIEWLDLIEGLPKTYRETVILHYAEGFRVREIADILNISQSTVKKRLVNAREKLKITYDERKELGVI